MPSITSPLKIKTIINKNKPDQKLGFSLIELSLAILVIGILVIGITQGTKILNSSKIASARSLTAGSPVSIIDGLRYWFEATSDKSFDYAEAIGGGPITNWYNINPNNSDGFKLTQNLNAQKPLYTKDAINGLPSLKFFSTSSNSYLNGLLPTSITSNQLEVFTVMQRTSITSNNYSAGSFYNTSVLDDYSDTRAFVFVAENGTVISTYRASTKSQMNHPGNGVPYIFSTRFNGVDNLSYLNGISFNTVASTGNFNINGIIIGNRWINFIPHASTELSYKGYIGELIIFDRALTKAERKNVTKYLSDKWRIPVSFNY